MLTGSVWNDKIKNRGLTLKFRSNFIGKSTFFASICPHANRVQKKAWVIASLFTYYYKTLLRNSRVRSFLGFPKSSAGGADSKISP